MKILGLQVQNFKRIKAINIHPKGNMVVLSGRNGQGKSSAIDSIWAALGGESGKEIPIPIRVGQARADIRLDLGEVVVTRSWTDNDKSYLKVEGKDGVAMKSPQTLLDGWVSDLTFDPLEFSRQDANAQRKMLINVSNLDTNALAELDLKRQRHYDDRTMVNRELRDAESALSSLPHVENPPSEEISVSDTARKLQEVQSQNSACERDRLEWVSIGEQIETLQQKKQSISAKWNAYPVNENNDLEEELILLIANAEIQNNSFRLYQQRLVAEKKFMSKQSESALLTTGIEQVDSEKIRIMTSAQMPMQGLTMDENGVFFNGTPFKQLSSAEQLRIASAIAMAKKSDLRILLIKDGSLMDEQSMEMLHAMAAEHDYQIWLEKVDSSGNVGIVIEEGEVVKEN